MSTGVSIKNIMFLFFLDGGKSEIRMNQSVGRGLRLHPKKEFLSVFDFQDNITGTSMYNQAKERNKIYLKENNDFELKFKEILIQ